MNASDSKVDVNQTRRGRILNPADLQAYIDRHELQARLVVLPVPTPTVEAAAKAVGIGPAQIIKSLLFWIKSEPILVVARGLFRVDPRLLARHFRVGRKQVKLVGAGDVLQISGYPIGAVPPFGHHTTLKTLMDAGVLQDQEVYAGGGAMNYLMRVSPEEILRVTGATVLELQTLDSTG
ncbi:MAG: YbaK/EbsC family protein [Anaerolineales bacterium]|nr:MAG: YbaK/EbsC family protein [Anaerolineales bacterium]